MLWNIRSTKGHAKKLVLIYIIKIKDLDFIFLQDTFLKTSNKLFIQGDRVYKSNVIERKGVTILKENGTRCEDS